MLSINKKATKYLVVTAVILVELVGSFSIEQKSAKADIPISTKPVNQQNNDAAKIRTVLDDNIRGMNTKNIDLAMSAIDENSPDYEQTRKLTQLLFDTYDLKYKINKFEILKISGNKATVIVTQTTKKIQGPAFRDNVSVAKHTLIKSNGRWRIKSTEIESINYLN